MQVSMLRTGGGGVGTGIEAAFEHFLCPLRTFYHIWIIFQAHESDIRPPPPPPKKKKAKKANATPLTIQSTLPIHTLINVQYILLTPFLRRHPLQLIKTIPPHPTQGSTKCPGDSEKSEVKKLCLTRSQLIIL